MTTHIVIWPDDAKRMIADLEEEQPAALLYWLRREVQRAETSTVYHCSQCGHPLVQDEEYNLSTYGAGAQYMDDRDLAWGCGVCDVWGNLEDVADADDVELQPSPYPMSPLDK